MSRLTPRQAAVLKYLAGLDPDGYLPTGSEIVFNLWRSNLFTSHEQGQRTCKQLWQKSLAEKVGWAEDNARTWRATDAGRELAKTLEASQ